MEKTDRKNKKGLKGCMLVLLLLLAMGVAFYFLVICRVYTAEDFGIQRNYASVDFNQNGIDDYLDLMLGARADVERNPQYDGQYWETGYPPEALGVCTDVVWRAFRTAGYALKDMIDQDIQRDTGAYPRVNGRPDPNIDFRRVPNLQVFLEKYAISLTLNPKEIDQWQPGDIVIYGTTHVAILSEKRNWKGIPYIIHNGGEHCGEENGLTRMEISGHYRFDASRIPREILISWEDRS